MDADTESATCLTLYSRATDNYVTSEMKMLPVHSLVLTSTAYPSRQLMQSEAEGPVQPLHDWWQATAT